MPRIRPGQRLWLHDEGEPIFGGGISDLLQGVESTGSLHQAAAAMGMAYSKAWKIVRRAEEHLGMRLIDRHVGGIDGGGSVVTDDGKWLLQAFGKFVRDSELQLDELFERHQGDRLSRR